MWEVLDTILVRLSPYECQRSVKYYQSVKKEVQKEIETILKEKAINLSNKTLCFLINKFFVDVRNILTNKVEKSSSDTAELYLTEWGDIFFNQSRNSGNELCLQKIMNIKSFTKDNIENYLSKLHKQTNRKK